MIVSRQSIELKFTVSLPDRASRTRLNENIRHRVRKEMERSIRIMGIKLHGIFIDSSRVKLDVTLPPNAVRQNIERALYGLLNGILKREVPHLMKRRG